MTRNLKALLKVQLIMAWRGLRRNMGGTESKWGMLLIPLMALAFIPFFAMMGGISVAIFLAGKALGQSHLLLVFALTAGQLACLVFGIFYVISAFFFNKDLKLLVPLPLRPSEIVVSKFITILVGEYLTISPIVLPALAVYGILGDVSWTYLPFALIIYLLLPVVPMVLASLFSLVLMRLTNLSRSRDLFRVAGALFGVIFALAFQFIARMGEGGFRGDSEAVQQLLQKNIAQSMGKWVPTSLWASGALQEGAFALGAPSFLLFVAVAAAAVVLMMWVAEKLFFGGLVGGDESRSSGKRLSSDELARETGRTRSPLWALLQREIRLLNRTPAFLMTALMPVVLAPVFIAIPMLQGNELGELISQAQGVSGSPIVAVAGIGAVMLFTTMTSVGATAVSREGRFFWISRSLPVAPRVQVQAKLLHATLLTLMVLGLVLGALGFIGLLTPSIFAYVLVGGLLASVSTHAGGMVIDIVRPNLTWTDPQQAMKGNMNGLFALLLMMVLGAVLAAVSAGLYFLARPLLLPGLVLLFAAETFALYRGAMMLADKRYLEYED